MSYIVEGADGLVATVELDRWRSAYQDGSGSREDLASVYAALSLQFPEQNYFSLPLAQGFMDRFRPRSVVELGGWDGGLAAALLPGNPQIVSWENYEVAAVPQTCVDKRYQCVVADGWAWEQPLEAQAFVASHVLEHLSVAHLGELIDAVGCRFAYVDVPLSQTPTTWAGSPTTHALTLSIEEFDGMWEQAGWKQMACYERGGPVPSHVRFLEHA